MDDAKMMGSLADRLLSFVSTTLVHDSNYEIAVLLLKNYSRLKDLSIGEVAELCYTSKASVSRFCRFMGFESFKEFRCCLEQDFTMRTDYSRQFYAMLCSNQQLAMAAYRDELISNIYATVTPENLEVIPDVVRALHDSRRIAYFSHHFLWDIGRYFQSKMMLMGRYVEQFIDHGAQLACARSLGREDLAIICTVGGSYTVRYPSIWNAIVASGCRLLVITQNYSNACLNNATFVLQCGHSNLDDVGKYAALMVNDLVVMSYMKQYDASAFQ